MHDDFSVSFGGRDWVCVDKGFPKDEPVDVVVRPEDVQVVEAADGMLRGKVEDVIFKGVHYEMEVLANGLHWVIQSTQSAPVGAEIGLSVAPDEIHIMEKLFRGDKNIFYGEVTDEHTITFFGEEISFERDDITYPVGSKVKLTVFPQDIEIVSEDQSHSKGFLESMIYKGAYNECILYAYEIDAPVMIYTQNDEQVATDIPFYFHTDRIEVTLCTEGEE